MTFCRATLIERLLNNNCNCRRSAITLGNPRSWNDINSFERDNITEVYQKLSNIEEEIWGKVIVMERNVRSAKAYLRSRFITIDGSESEFDGFSINDSTFVLLKLWFDFPTIGFFHCFVLRRRIGLKRFENLYRDDGTIRAMELFGKGVKMKIDDFGNVWLKCTEGSVFVNGILGEMVVKNDPIKIFDLKILKELVIRQKDMDDIAARDRYSRMAIIYAHIDRPTDALSSALWFAVIHLTALEMIQILLANNSDAELQNVNHNDSYVQSGNIDVNCNGRTFSSSSSGSSSHHSGLSPAYCNRLSFRSRGGAYKKIIREPNAFPSSRIVPNHTQQIKENGGSLLDLSDLDRLHNPIYFRKELEDRSDPRRRRLNHFTQQISSSPLKPFGKLSNINWRSRSETSIYCERL